MLKKLEKAAKLAAELFDAITGVKVSMEAAEDGIFSAPVDLSQVVRRFSRRALLLVTRKDLKYLKEIYPTDVRRGERLHIVIRDRSRASLSPDSACWIQFGLEDLKVLTGIASLDSHDQRRVRLARLLANRIPLDSLNPYSTVRTARRGMFFDRRPELDTLVGGAEHAAIVGPRRIGKSSLLEAVADRLADDTSNYVSRPGAEHPVLPMVLVSCLFGLDTIWDELYDQIGMTIHDRSEGRRHALTDPVKRTYRRVSAFESFLRIATYQYPRAIILLDEVDGLLFEDRKQQWRFFSELLSVTIETNARVILAGYSDLFRTLGDMSFPFFGRMRRVLARNLPAEDARLLIEVPFHDLQISISEPAIEEILLTTNGAPAQIHAVCSALLRNLDAGDTVSERKLNAALKEATEYLNVYRSFLMEASVEARLVLFLAAVSIHKRLDKRRGAGDVPKTLSLSDARTVAASNLVSADELVPEFARLANDFLTGNEIRRSVYQGLDELVLRNVLMEVETYSIYQFASLSVLSSVLEDASGQTSTERLEETRRSLREEVNRRDRSKGWDLLRPLTVEALVEQIGSKLRPMIRSKPEAEREVQDALEAVLIGVGVGTYVRERGAVPYSTRSYVPDFVLPDLKLAIEAKLCNRADRESQLVSEINDDLRGYGRSFPNLLFVVYDTGHLRSVDRFKHDLEVDTRAQVLVIKH